MAPGHKHHHHKDLLRVLAVAKPSLRKAILKEADKPLVYSICEICDNLLKGHVPISEKQKNQLKKHKTLIRKIAQKGEGWKKKKAHLQRGGAAVLPLLLSILGSVLPSILGN